MIVNSKELHLLIKKTNKKEIHMCKRLELLKEKGRIESKIEDICNLIDSIILSVKQVMDTLKILLSQKVEIEVMLIQ